MRGRSKSGSGRTITTNSRGAKRRRARRRPRRAEHPQLRGLDKAFDDFTAAAKARETVWDEYRAAKDREIAAEAAVNKELGALEPSTSCVKREPTAAAAALPTGMRPPGMSPDMPRLAPPPGMPPPGMPPLGMPPDAAARHRLVFVIEPPAPQLASCALVRVVYDNEQFILHRPTRQHLDHGLGVHCGCPDPSARARPLQAR